MLRSILGSALLLVAVLVLVGGSAKVSPPKEARSDRVVWRWALHDEDDKKLAEGTFVVHGLTICGGKGNQIGSYENVSEDVIRVDVNEGKLKGKFELTRDKDSRSSWKGELENDKGGKNKVYLRYENLKK